MKVDTHDIVIGIGTLALTAWLFVHPQAWPLWEITAAYVGLACGQGGAEAAIGLRNRLQGGSTPPDVIVPPAKQEN